MKTEAILTRVNGILAMSDEPTPIRSELAKLADELADQVRMEYAASCGIGNAARTIRAMLNAEKKHGCRRSLQYAWIDSQGRQCVCDGYRAFRLTEPLPLEERPADAGDPINLDKVMPNILCDHAAMPLPDVKEVKAFIAVERAANGRKATPLWDFGEGKPAVSAQYLVDLMAVLPDAQEIYYSTAPDGMLSPLYAKSERGDAVLLPIRTPHKAAQSEALKQAAQKAAKEAAERAKYYAELVAGYRESVERDPEYAVTPATFALLAKYAPAA